MRVDRIFDVWLNIYMATTLAQTVRLNLHRAIIGKYAADNLCDADVRRNVLLSSDEDGIDVFAVLVEDAWDKEFARDCALNGVHGWRNGVELF